MTRLLIALSTLLLCALNPAVAENTPVRVAALAFGTVNWELQTIRKQNLDRKLGFTLEIHEVASPQAAKIALQSAAVDLVVSDWIWTSRQREDGRMYTFVPYSTTSGALMLAAGSEIAGIGDLSGKKLGIAGGELDKNWLLLQALARKQTNIDLNQDVDKVYGAPPLLNQQLRDNQLDAVMNYWHYAARLQAHGSRRLLDGRQILQQLGISAALPTLGYVFDESWAQQNSAPLNGFLQAAREARELLCTNQVSWDANRALTRVDDPVILQHLRQRYCEGRIRSWGTAEQQAAEKVFQILRGVNSRLTGSADHLQPGTFWAYEVPRNLHSAPAQ